MLDLVAFLVGVISLIFSFYIYKRYGTLNNMIEKEIENIGKGIRNHIDEELKPVKNAVARSMPAIASVGNTQSQQKALNRRIAQDVINQQDPIIKMIMQQFPQASEYVKKNPDLILELIPRIQALGGIEGFKLSDLGGKTPSPSRTQPHPLDREL